LQTSNKVLIGGRLSRRHLDPGLKAKSRINRLFACFFNRLKPVNQRLLSLLELAQQELLQVLVRLQQEQLQLVRLQQELLQVLVLVRLQQQVQFQ
jgi:hypothetical protein